MTRAATDVVAAVVSMSVLGLAPGEAAAQPLAVDRWERAPMYRSQTARLDLSSPPLTPHRRSSHGRSRTLYIVGGALAGGTAMAAGMCYAPGGDAIVTPQSVVPAVAGSMIVGGLIGWLVHEIRH